MAVQVTDTQGDTANSASIGAGPAVGPPGQAQAFRVRSVLVRNWKRLPGEALLPAHRASEGSRDPKPFRINALNRLHTFRRRTRFSVTGAASLQPPRIRHAPAPRRRPKNALD